MKRNEIAKRKEDSTNEELEKLEKTKNLIIKINNGISIVVFILIFIGFMIYMGRKKYEYIQRSACSDSGKPPAAA